MGGGRQRLFFHPLLANIPTYDLFTRSRPGLDVQEKGDAREEPRVYDRRRDRERETMQSL